MSKAEDYHKPGTRKILQKIIDDPKIKSALRALVANACLDTLTVVEESGLAVTQVGLSLPEGPGDIPETYSKEKKIPELFALLEELKSTRTEVAKTDPWVTAQEEYLMRSTNTRVLESSRLAAEGRMVFGLKFLIRASPR